MPEPKRTAAERPGHGASPVRHGHMSITDIADRGMIDLQLAEPDEAVLETVSGVIGTALPADARHSSANGSLVVLGRGPGHWVISCPAGELAGWLGRLEIAVAGCLAMVTCVGDGYAILRLRGDAAGGVLLRGADVDLYGREGNQGAVAHARLAGVDVMIHAIDAGRRGFDIYVPRSLTERISQWLEDTARNSAIVTPFGAGAPARPQAKDSRA